MHRLNLHSAILAAALAGAVGLFAGSAAAEPDSGAGYSCGEILSTPFGDISVSGTPGPKGITTIGRQWQLKGHVRRGNFIEMPVLAEMQWSGGPGVKPDRVRLAVSITVDSLPPYGSWVYLRLSGGQVLGDAFADRRTYDQSKKLRGGVRFGHDVRSNSWEFAETFIRSDWAVISVVDPKGAVLAENRIDLYGLRDTLGAVGGLEAQLQEDARDFAHKCRRIQTELQL